MSGWRQTALRELLDDATPGFACGEDLEDGVFQFRMNNITADGQLDLSKRRRVPSDYRNIDRFSLQPGDVLFNATNSPDLVGKTAYFPGLEEPAVFSNHFLRLRPRDSELDGRFLSRWLNLEFQRGRFKGMCRQWVNQATVSRDALLPMKVPLPPLLEQRRIAEILDKADALRARRRAALAQLDTLTLSIFFNMFGDPATNPKGWPVRRIGELLESASYGTSEKSGASGEFPVLRMNNITRTGEMDFADLKFMDLDEDDRDRYLVRAGDVLFNRTNSPELVGKTGIFRESKPMAYAGYLIRLRVTEENNPEFLSTYLNTTYSKRTLRGMCKSIIGMANINATEIQAMRIPQPPTRLQRDFARKVAAVEKLKTAQRAFLAEQDMLFAALQADAFQGAP
jgi:type I restriction enzyme, S subunit